MSENEKVHFIFPSGKRSTEQLPTGSVRNLYFGLNVQLHDRNFTVSDHPTKTEDGWEVPVEEQMSSNKQS